MKKISLLLCMVSLLSTPVIAATKPLVAREFYITRHGESDHNAQGIVGDDSAKLTAKGREDAAHLWPVFFTLFPDAKQQVYLVSSDLTRAKNTARIMSKNIVKLHTDARLNERISGKLAQVPPKKAGELLVLLEENDANYVLDLLGTEQAEKHIARVAKGMNFHLRKARKNKTPVFVSHLKTMLEIAAIAGHDVQYFGNSTLFHFVPQAGGSWEIFRVSAKDGQLMRTDYKKTATLH